MIIKDMKRCDYGSLSQTADRKRTFRTGSAVASKRGMSLPIRGIDLLAETVISGCGPAGIRKNDTMT
jgi:hypothetical protein